jgi:CRP-like cAMP-binding protein
MNLNDVEIFGLISSEARNEIARDCIEETMSKGTIIFQQGDRADFLYILTKGSINLIIKEKDIAIHSLSKPGDIFGWSSIVKNGVYAASCDCNTDTTVMKIQKEKIDAIFNSHPKDAVTILRYLGSIFSKRIANIYKGY